jgi:hypothetical protein
MKPIKYEKENPTKLGRPPKFFTPEQMKKEIDKYFKECQDNTSQVVTKEGLIVDIKDPKIPCYAGLAYALDMDRHQLWNYSNKDDFYLTIKKARDLITQMLEDSLINSKNNPVGKIFISKNYGYTDKQEIEMIKPLEIVLSDYRGAKKEEKDGPKQGETGKAKK